MGAAIKAPVDDQGEADAGADPKKNEVGHVAAMPVLALGQGGKVDVVLERDVGAKLLPDRLHQPVPSPAREIRGHGHVTVNRVEHARAAEHGVRDLRPVHTCFLRELAGDGADLADQGPRASDLRSLVTARHDGAGDVRDGSPRPAPPDVDSDDPSRARVELIEQRAGSSLSAGPAHLADKLRVQQAGEGQRDGRLREPAHPRDLRARQRPAAMDQLQHRALVDRAQQAGRASGDPRLIATDKSQRSGPRCCFHS